MNILITGAKKITISKTNGETLEAYEADRIQISGTPDQLTPKTRDIDGIDVQEHNMEDFGTESHIGQSLNEISIRGLPNHITDHEIQVLVEKFGETVSIIRSKLGVIYVTFKDSDGAANAVINLDGQTHYGNIIYLKMVRLMKKEEK